MPENEVAVVKGGETCIMISLQRTAAGLSVNTKVHSRVEEFMRINNQDNKVDVRTMTRNWKSQGDKPLYAYIGGERFGNIALGEGAYNIDQIGGNLMLPNNTLNMSFLRLVGISEGAGVTFTIGGVYSNDSLENLKRILQKAARKFYVDYLRPIDVTVTVSTQELRY
jgi:hypothetical protein